MSMHNPPHPGEFIAATYLEPFGMSVRYLAKHLKVAASTLHRIINGTSAISPDMACRLSIVLGRSAESWLLMQAQYDLSRIKEPKLKRIHFDEMHRAA